MAELIIEKNQKQIKRVIALVSVVVPLLVAVLLFLPYKLDLPKEVVYSLPLANAVINSLTSALLILALVFVKQRKFELHKKAMLGAVGLGALFLVLYVLYHSSAPSTKFGDVNGDAIVDTIESAAIAGSVGIYYFILISHILLAAIVLPFVLMAVYFGLSGKLRNHKKIARWAYPVWLYVSITGVVVYLMISPYYQA